MIIEFSDTEMDILSQALGQRPYLQVASLINKINQQILASQNKPPQELVLPNLDCETLGKNNYFDQ